MVVGREENQLNKKDETTQFELTKNYRDPTKLPQNSARMHLGCSERKGEIEWMQVWDCTHQLQSTHSPSSCLTQEIGI